MAKIIRLANTFWLKDSNPKHDTIYLAEATHQYFHFAEYESDERGFWHESRAWAGAIPQETLFAVLAYAGLLREITVPQTEQNS